MKRGDKLVSVDGNSLNGLTQKATLKLLKDTGTTVQLLLSRKVGYSVAPSQVTSQKQSVQVGVYMYMYIVFRTYKVIKLYVHSCIIFISQFSPVEQNFHGLNVFRALNKFTVACLQIFASQK